MKRFASRKFLLTVAGLAVLATAQQWSFFVIVLTSYLGINTVATAVTKNSK